MTADWSAGYVSEINYTYGFYRELTPAILIAAALANNQAAPSLADNLTYCELGCGQGVSTNLLAAANPNIQFVATDFNPSQITGAQALAREAGTPNVRFLDDSFAELAARADLPDFNIIALHGIYSWISLENRGHIVEFIRRRLKPGGLVYISYNTLPGWASAMPLRRLFVDEAAEHGGPILGRIEQALAFTQELVDTKAKYFLGNPGTTERLGRIKDQPKHYLAHEYFNRDWTPFYFADVVSELSAAKLSWIGSANLLDAMAAVCLTPDQQKYLAKIASVYRREGLRDFIINQQFRRDIFAKGPLPLSPVAAHEKWSQTTFALSIPRAQLVMKIAAPIGEVSLQEDVYGPVADVLSEGPIRFAALVAHPRIAPLGHARVQQALTILMGAGHVQPCPDQDGLTVRRKSTDRFNKAVTARARLSGDLTFLASPVTGGGIAVDRLAQLFLAAIYTKQADPVQFVWAIFQAAGQRFLKNGAALQTPEENVAEMNERYQAFIRDQLPLYRLLGLV